MWYNIGMNDFPKPSLPHISVPNGEDTAIFLLYPYAPYEETDVHHLRLDAYYPASNAVYQQAIAYAERLSQAGYRAEAGGDFPFRPLLMQSGVFTRGDNSLLYHPQYGSYFALGLVTVKGVRLGEGGKKAGECLHCGGCRSICPTRALTEEGFFAERCIRAQMNTPPFLEGALPIKIGNRLYGCGSCQAVCPMQTATPVPYPGELKELLYLPAFTEACLAGKKALAPLLPYIGANYIRPVRFLCLAAVAMQNTGDQSYLPLLERLCSYREPRVRAQAEWAAERLRRLHG